MNEEREVTSNGADVFEAAPRAPGEVRFHMIGAVLNGTALLGGLIGLFAAWSKNPPSWPWVLLALFTGIYAADLVSGLLHWAFDTWFDEDITFLRRMVLQAGPIAPSAASGSSGDWNG